MLSREVADDVFAVGMPDGLLLKSTPHTEGDRRFIYCEPSTESWDQQNEMILQKALAASREHFLKFGNVDIDHLSMIGARPRELGGLGMTPAEAKLYEIGVPVDVRIEPRVVLKSEIYSGEGQQVEQANYFWDTVTKTTPAKRWYPSVAGRRPVKDCTPSGCVIKAFLWTNVAFAREPVNQAVKSVSLVPLDEFMKAMTAGYGTDASQLSGGGALRRESLQGSPLHQTNDDGEYSALAGRYLKAVRDGGTCEHTSGSPSVSKIVNHFQHCEGASADAARAHAARLIRQVAERRRAARANHQLAAQAA